MKSAEPKLDAWNALREKKKFLGDQDYFDIIENDIKNHPSQERTTLLNFLLDTARNNINFKGVNVGQKNEIEAVNNYANDLSSNKVLPQEIGPSSFWKYHADQPKALGTYRDLDKTLYLNVPRIQASKSNKPVQTLNHELTHVMDYDPAFGGYQSTRSLKDYIKTKLPQDYDSREYFKQMGNIMGSSYLELLQRESDDSLRMPEIPAEISRHMFNEWQQPTSVVDREIGRKTLRHSLKSLRDRWISKGLNRDNPDHNIIFNALDNKIHQQRKPSSNLGNTFRGLSTQERNDFFNKYKTLPEQKDYLKSLYQQQKLADDAWEWDTAPVNPIISSTNNLANDSDDDFGNFMTAPVKDNLQSKPEEFKDPSKDFAQGGYIKAPARHNRDRHYNQLVNYLQRYLR